MNTEELNKMYGGNVTVEDLPVGSADLAIVPVRTDNGPGISYYLFYLRSERTNKWFDVSRFWNGGTLYCRINIDGRENHYNLPEFTTDYDDITPFPDIDRPEGNALPFQDSKNGIICQAGSGYLTGDVYYQKIEIKDWKQR